MPCVRCGSEGHLEYGSDGLAYCSSCIFYGLNKPCWKCRMYLPASELQTYNGQLTCQYCIMDLKDEERRRERFAGGHEDKTIGGERSEERCERCGRAMTTVYSFRGKMLCGQCVDEEKRDVGAQGGERPPMVVFRQKAEGPLSKIVSMFEKKIGEAIREKNPEPKQEAAKSPPQVPSLEEKGASPSAPSPKSQQPISEERVKTGGVKYELAPFKDLEFEGRSSSRAAIPKSEEKSRNSEGKKKPKKK